MSLWVFLRHGESEANRSRVFSGHQDVALTDLGESQARTAGEQIAELGPVQCVISSDLRRARRTAELALAAAGISVHIHTTPALRERHLGEWQGQSIDRLKAEGARDVLHSWTGHAPGGESLAMLASRAVPFLVNEGDNGTTLLAGHGGLIRVLLGLIDGTPLDEIGRVNIPNAVPITRELDPDSWTNILRQLNR